MNERPDRPYSKFLLNLKIGRKPNKLENAHFGGRFCSKVINRGINNGRRNGF